ncbi:hypothetical protein [Cohnella sp. GCM10027633]|uniref:hypothetical protein n=1 Tax=unclassified Cohnella TaxID=2636738 RepID=UPI00363D22FA
MKYTDPKYGFSLRLPDWWTKYIVVERLNRFGEALYGVQFLFKYEGKVYTDVLTLSVYRMTRKQWRDRGYDDTPLNFLAERNGRIFVYSVPGEPPEEFYDENSEDGYDPKYAIPLDLLRRMINDDVPRLVKTFKLAVRQPVKRRPPSAGSR